VGLKLFCFSFCLDLILVCQFALLDCVRVFFLAVVLCVKSGL